MDKKFIVMRKLGRQKRFTPFNIALQSKKTARKEVRMLKGIVSKDKLKTQFRIKRADRLTVKEIKQIGGKEDIIRFLQKVK